MVAGVESGGAKSLGAFTDCNQFWRGEIGLYKRCVLREGIVGEMNTV